MEQHLERVGHRCELRRSIPCPLSAATKHTASTVAVDAEHQCVSVITERRIPVHHTESMSETASIERIERQIAALNLQEEDARELLLLRPNISTQVQRMLLRIRTDREHLIGVICEAKTRGRREVHWSELVAHQLT